MESGKGLGKAEAPSRRSGKSMAEQGEHSDKESVFFLYYNTLRWNVHEYALYCIQNLAYLRSGWRC
jgi:hypothetical protein